LSGVPARVQKWHQLGDPEIAWLSTTACTVLISCSRRSMTVLVSAPIVGFELLASAFRILFVADIVGRPGREAFKALLPGLQRRFEPHLTVVNGENAAGGFGITAKIVEELRRAGADVITTGN